MATLVGPAAGRSRLGSAVLLVAWLLASSLPAANPNALELRDVDGTIVNGIVCDNLPGMPHDPTSTTDKVNKLLLSRAGQPNAVAIAGQVVGPENAEGRIVIKDGSAAYFPPDEFNVPQEPKDADAVTRDPYRQVALRVTFRLWDGRITETESNVWLARPPVVLVHGINVKPDVWRPLIRYCNRTVKGSDGGGIPFLTVNHYPNDRGNGRVEDAAAKLADLITRTKRNLRDGVRLSDPLDGAGFSTYAVKGLHLASKRVDAIGWSYGGVVARWYLASDGTNPSQDWYRDFRGPSTGVRAYDHDVRKLITLGSPWRGAPITNILNEIHFNKLQIGIGPTTHRLLDIAALFISTKAPAHQVMAIESPWLRRLLYPQGTHAEAIPFVPDVAYGSVAGTRNDYPFGFGPFVLGRNDIYHALHRLQRPVRFPYVALEYRLGFSKENYSDGVVPVWSSAIPGSYIAAPSTHNAYTEDKKTREYVLVSLNHRHRLRQGRELNEIWNRPDLKSRIDRPGGEPWSFRPGRMAPYPQHDVYDFDPELGIGRFAAGTTGVMSERPLDVHPTLKVDNMGRATVELRLCAKGCLIVTGVQIEGVWLAWLGGSVAGNPVALAPMTVSREKPGTVQLEFSSPIVSRRSRAWLWVELSYFGRGSKKNLRFIRPVALPGG